jgi:hypothetical protein
MLDGPLKPDATKVNSLENRQLALKQASCEADRPGDGFLLSFDLIRS